MKIPIMLKAQGILDKSFKEASKYTDHIREKMAHTKFIDRAKRLETLRIERSYAVSKKELENIVLKTPMINELPEFYREFVESQIDADKFRQALNHAAATEKNMFNLRNRYVKGVKHARNAKECEVKRKRFYGRMSSFFMDLEDDIDFLIKCAKELSIAPHLNEDLFTVVIAGMPNVGKSTLLINLTGSSPEVAKYPFTTKRIFIGKFQYDYTEFQVLDTPGILDRPNKERNKIELQAVSAIRHLADAAIFVFDPTETCGFSCEKQLALFSEIKKSFPMPMLLVFSKTDIIGPKELEKRKKEFDEPIIETSQKSSPSIENLKKKICILGGKSQKVRLSKTQLQKQKHNFKNKNTVSENQNQTR
ncbi:MAG: 50S ribosome-binding GTPase [Candidatus Diapherotrites archaeon]|nr:50S ribosome-binding GTPase [Candidatus Diapherotrites archaeon]